MWICQLRFWSILCREFSFVVHLLFIIGSIVAVVVFYYYYHYYYYYCYFYHHCYLSVDVMINTFGLTLKGQKLSSSGRRRQCGLVSFQVVVSVYQMCVCVCVCVYCFFENLFVCENGGCYLLLTFLFYFHVLVMKVIQI